MASRISQVVGLITLAAGLAGCQPAPPPAPAPRTGTRDAVTFWNAATVYFLLTDRFENGDPSNDGALGRRRDGAMLRSLEGGDLRGVLQRLEAGYFDSLGVHAIWLTPFVEQIRGSVDEGTGRTWPFHGYWIRDWTAVDPALGTAADLRALVDAAHRRGIRVLMDAVINHTGPVTPADPVWPADWVRTTPQCTYRSYATTVDCTLVANLPDLLTDADAPVTLPPFLVEKWQREGRLAQEQAELDAFFARTGYPRAPRYYVIKWLTDWVRELGIDGYRVDTSKHFGESVSLELKQEAEVAFADWKRANPSKVIDGLPFHMMGEVYGWELSHGRGYDFGDRTVDYFANGYDALINFAFKRDAAAPIDETFARYAAMLATGDLRGVAILNYVSSHDDGGPFDRDRRQPAAAGTRLLLAPGGAQVYYGDELARPLQVPGADGDANLRSPMNWRDRGSTGRAEAVLSHWRRLGRFRHAHPAIGAGVHRQLQASPYVFSRILDAGALRDRVVIGLDFPAGPRMVPVAPVWRDGTVLREAYLGTTVTVRDGMALLPSGEGPLLLEERRPAGR